MKRVFCILLLGILCFNLSAQNNKAKEVLDKVSAKNKEFKSIKAEFTFSMDNEEEDIHDESEGSIILMGDKYRLKVMGTDNYFDGTTLYSHMIDSEEVNITEPEEDEDGGLDPSKIFTIYESGFSYKYVKEESKGNVSYHVIDLFPKDTEKEFTHIRLRINKAKSQIESLESVGKDGNNINIVLKSLTPNLSFSASDFVFDQESHPDVEINDMR
jgi:outer membrane lipoprotein-sorting protein